MEDEAAKQFRPQVPLSFPTAKLRPRDGFLAVLVLLAEIEAIKDFSVTLTVGGLTISGQLISPRAYFEETRDSILDAVQRQGGDARSRDFWDTTLSSLAEARRVTVRDLERRHVEEGAGPIEDLLPEFVHLRNARFYMDLTRPLTVGTLWRGRLEEVDGFTIGEIIIR